MWGSAKPATTPRPGTIKQVRGATYPPLTSPPPRSGRPLTPSSARSLPGVGPSIVPASPAGSPGCISTPAGSPGVRPGTSRTDADGAPSQAAAQATPSGEARAQQNGAPKLTPGSSSGFSAGFSGTSFERQRLLKFEALLGTDVVDLRLLRSAGWSGIPSPCRAMSWQLLLGYLPPNLEWRESTLQRKRREYCESVPQYFDIADSERTEYQRKTLHQILIDVPRTCTSSAIFHHEVVQRALERVLYIWALRHPASGYVQGINDLVTPFFIVFLSDHLPRDRPHRMEDVDSVPPHILAQVEADSFWCLSKLLDSVQDHYTFAQPGIQRMVFKLKELVARIDAKLHAHLLDQGLHFIQFAFRWMNCLLMRELSLDLILRVWDTYLAEYGGSEDEPNEIGDGFAVLHVYMCAALMVRWSEDLQQMDFQEMVIFLQHLPTSGWSSKDIGELLSQAYIFKTMFHHAPSHLNSS